MLCFFIGQVVLRTLFFDWSCCSAFLSYYFVFILCRGDLVLSLDVDDDYLWSPIFSENVTNVKSGDECLFGVEDEAKACFNLLVEFAIA